MMYLYLYLLLPILAIFYLAISEHRYSYKSKNLTIELEPKKKIPKKEEKKVINGKNYIIRNGFKFEQFPIGDHNLELYRGEYKEEDKIIPSSYQSVFPYHYMTAWDNDGIGYGGIGYGSDKRHFDRINYTTETIKIKIEMQKIELENLKTRIKELTKLIDQSKF